MTLTLLLDILHTQVAVIQYAAISFCQNSILLCTTFLGRLQITYCSPKSFKSDNFFSEKTCFSILKTTEKLSKNCKKLAEKLSNLSEIYFLYKS